MQPIARVTQLLKTFRKPRGAEEDARIEIVVQAIRHHKGDGDIEVAKAILDALFPPKVALEMSADELEALSRDAI